MDGGTDRRDEPAELRAGRCEVEIPAHDVRDLTVVGRVDPLHEFGDLA
jgi:hypothetical protein